MNTTAGETTDEPSQPDVEEYVTSQYKDLPARVATATTLSSSSSIWNTLSEDEQRMRRLRDRLAALRESSAHSSTVKEEETTRQNFASTSDSSVGSNSTLTTHSTTGMIPTQEEARLLRQGRTTVTNVPPRFPHHHHQQQQQLLQHPLDSQQSQTNPNGRQHNGPRMPSTLPPLPTSPGIKRVSPRHFSKKSEGAKTMGPSPESRAMNSLAALEQRAIREAGKNFRPAAGQPGHQQSTDVDIHNSLEQEHQERLHRELPQGDQHDNYNNNETTADHPNRARRKASRELLDEKHRLQSPQPSPLRRPRPRVPGYQHRVGAFPMAGESSQEEKDEDNESTTAVRPTLPSPDVSMTSVIPVAAIVVEDFEREELCAKEQQLREQERELAEKMQRLQAWEAELQRQKEELEQRQRMGSIGPYLATSTIVEAEVVEAEHPEPSRGIFSSFLQTRQPTPRHESEDYFTTNTHSSRQSTDDYSSACGSFFDQTICSDSIRTEEALNKLGEGPLRFVSHGERSLEEQIQHLPIPDKRAFSNLKQSWEDYQAKMSSMGGNNNASFDMPSSWHLRFLRFTANKDGTFNHQRAFQAEKKLKRRFLNLNVFALERQLETKTLFPVPGLKTRGGHAMFYMRPARYIPGKTTTKAIIDNLCYVMNTMLENEHAQQEGIGFIACMDEWKMKNFEVNYCYQFMMSLQGFMVPVKTQLFLIVNPPAWFGVIWRIMKPMLAPSFRTRVKICNENKISKYLAPDFAMHLPDDMSTGQVPTDAIVEDFISYRRHFEASSVSRGNVATRSDDAHHSTSHHSHESPVNEDGFDQLSWHDDFTSERSSVARARLPGDTTDRSIISAGESTNSGRHQSSHYDDDDDLASIDANIDDDHLSDEEDLKEPPLSI